MTDRNPRVDAFLAAPGAWRAEFAALRTIALDSGLTEDLKWGWPCYTLDKRNVVLMHGFKDYCALLFPKGALLADPDHVLIQQTANVQAARQIRFTGVDEIVAMEAVLQACIREAIALETSGAKVVLKTAEAFTVADEFKMALEASDELRKAFDTLTPGRRRAYLLRFSSAKQSKTRSARVESAIPRILAGKGLDD
ncbi:uncharacterized protein YdeI (YjbR/CyaY-like superfamily) [Roseiarcus fermentans]|uniref:Uncharacterized protein YdeI (YjbR/CyaY-like superfamily) n=1 Tax=Roseiarcus fermentans TaxID=1473586 RepID=A0A366EKE5_9HYPH|nr:DUF1801 domain-containing protein [Roseiarcus fermentans]RBP02828.1 uncharacterized protein YdeI (YjbR/CyaY-like superfamily) [Roseiarcus fermentans]